MANEPKIYSTKEWGARAVTFNPELQDGVGIVIHHMFYPNRPPKTGDEEEQEAFSTARKCQRDHMARKWVDTGQHFTVSRGGLLLEGRTGSLAQAKQGLAVRGAHAGDDKHNRTWFGIENEGTYHQTLDMPEAQQRALVELCAWLCVWSDFRGERIKGHRDVKNTDCPGLIQGQLPRLRAAVEKRRQEILGS